MAFKCHRVLQRAAFLTTFLYNISFQFSTADSFHIARKHSQMGKIKLLLHSSKMLDSKLLLSVEQESWQWRWGNLDKGSRPGACQKGTLKGYWGEKFLLGCCKRNRKIGEKKNLSFLHFQDLGTSSGPGRQRAALMTAEITPQSHYQSATNCKFMHAED